MKFHECPSCAYKSAKMYNVQRHMNKLHACEEKRDVVRNFGDENTDHITFDLAILSFARGTDGIDQMMHAIFFNDKHPENFNIRITMNNDMCEVKKHDEWVPIKTKEAIHIMMAKAVDTIAAKMGPDVLDAIQEGRISFTVDQK